MIYERTRARRRGAAVVAALRDSDRRRPPAACLVRRKSASPRPALASRLKNTCPSKWPVTVLDDPALLSSNAAWHRDPSMSGSQRGAGRALALRADRAVQNCGSRPCGSRRPSDRHRIPRSDGGYLPPTDAATAAACRSNPVPVAPATVDRDASATVFRAGARTSRTGSCLSQRRHWFAIISPVSR